MASATLNLRVQASRLLTEADAAHYCGRPLKRFKAECSTAPIVMANGDIRYDIRDLDKWIDGLKAGSSDDDEIIGRLG